MRKPFKKCKWEDYCTTCDDIKDKQETCYGCDHYSMIDSGYGYCHRFPPKMEQTANRWWQKQRWGIHYQLVEWDRRACGEFSKR